MVKARVLLLALSLADGEWPSLCWMNAERG